MTEKKDTPQEIDLIELFTNIGNWIGEKINWLYHIFLHIFYFFVRKSLWLVLFITIGAIVGYYSFQSQASKPYYRTNIVAKSYTISSDEVIQIINNWDYVSEFKENELNGIMKVEANYLLDINDDNRWDIFEIPEKSDELDTAIMNQRVPQFFCIQSEVFDTVIIPNLKEKILNLLNTNERVVRLNTIRLKQKEALIPKIQEEIAELDSLKKLEYFGKHDIKAAKVGEIVMLTPKETKLYHNDILALIVLS